MSIYFSNRTFRDPHYQNPEYLRQQRTFINLLKNRTDQFALKVGELELEGKDGRLKETASILIDLRDVSNTIVTFSNSQIQTSVHELFEIWSLNPDADCHIIQEELKVYNLEEFLGECHDILTVRFANEWKKTG